MIPYLGDFAEDATLYFCFNTFDNSGASVAPSVAGTISVYKDKATDTEVTTGVTTDMAYDTIPGVHNVEIVLTDAFYATGCDYHVILTGATIDGQAVNAAIATFSIENRSEQTTLAAVAAAADVLYTASGFTLADGSVQSGAYTDTSSDNGTKYVVQMEADTDTNIDVRLEFAMGANRIATEVGINGYFDAAAVRSVQVYAYNYTTASWDKLSSASVDCEMRHATADRDYVFVLSPAHTDGVGGTAGDVEIRFYSDGDAIDEDDLYLDYVYVNGASTGGASPQAIAIAVHDELEGHLKHIPLFTGSIYYVDGTSGSDGNTGHTPDAAFATIGTAVTAAGAGGMVRVFAGTYSEAVTLAANGLELHCEKGTIIDGTTGVPLTISANNCKVIGAHLTPDDGQIGCVITGDYNYMELCESHTTGTSGWQLSTAAAGNQFVRCIASNFTGAGWDIKGPNNTWYLCSAVGEGGSETGFHLSDTAAHRNMFYQCATIDCATAGWDCDTGADDNLFVLCADSVGCGAKVDDGANNAWRSFASADVPEADLTYIHGTALTETDGQLAGGFKKFFNVSSPTGTVNSLPDAVAGVANGVFIAGTNAATSITTALTANIIGDITGTLDTVTTCTTATTVTDRVTADVTYIHGTALTETAGQLAGAFTKFFDVAAPTGTVNSLPDAVAGVANGVFIAGTNAATSITTALTANIIGNITGALSGAVGSVGTGGITAASIADAAIDNATFAADVGTTAYATNRIALAGRKVLDELNLDHLMKVAVADGTDMTAEVVDDTVLANIMTKTDGDTSDYDFTSDSLEAQADGAIEAAAWECTLTIQNTAGTANIDGATVWMSTQTSGTPAYTAPGTTAGGGAVTFWLADGVYYVFAVGGGYSYANDGGTTEKLTVSGVGVNGTYKLGTAIAGNVGGASSTAFLTRMVNSIRTMTDEPTVNKKYSDAQLYDFIQESYIQILADVQHNSNTQIVSTYTFTYDSDIALYALPATTGTVLSIGQEDTTTGTRWFYEKGGQLSEYGSKVSLEGNFVRVQPGSIVNDATVTVWYLADGCASLFNAASTTFDTTSVTFGTLNAGTRDVRPYAYVGSKLRVLNDTVNSVEQERIITAQSGDTYEKYTISPAFSPALTTPVEFEIIPDFPRTMDNVVAIKVAMRLVGVEGDTDRRRTLEKDYVDAKRTLIMSAAHKDFQQGSLRRNDGYQGPRGSRPSNRRPRRIM